MSQRLATIDRSSGIAMWRQIADTIRLQIAAGEYAVEAALPPESALAERFGVNRHTVRAAISALVSEGILLAQRGRGTFVRRRERLRFPIGQRTRFSTGFADQAGQLHAEILAASKTEAEVSIASALHVGAGTPLLRLDMLYRADGVPVSIASNLFPLPRFKHLESAVRDSHSITVGLAQCGVSDYLRHATTLTARHADSTDSELLMLSPGAIVLHAEAVNIDESGTPIQHIRTRFAADRVELTVEK
jgi:GntR family phosphonate transport system transcriptional regulator